MSDFNVIDGRVVAGNQGEGVLIESIEFRFGVTKDGEDEVTAELSGTAKTVLKDNYRPSAGWDELPAEIPVSERVKFVVGTGKKDDNSILYDRLNKALNITPPLVDTPDTWERFTQDGKESVYNQIVGKPLYFAAKKATGKTGEKYSDFFFNVLAIDKRVESKMDKVASRMKEVMAKKAAKASAPAFDPNS